MRKSLLPAGYIFALLTLTVRAQTVPKVDLRAVVNAASFVGSPRLVAGGITTIFGSNLAQTTELATDAPLPRMLAGTSVTVNGNAAPLFYVSPRQINFQMPSVPPGLVKIAVTTSAGDTGTISATTEFSAPGIFLQGSGSCDQPAVQNVRSYNGDAYPNRPGSSGSAGEYLSIYGTGFGPVYFPPPDGMAAGSDQLSRNPATGSATLGFPGFRQVTTSADFSGRAPGQVGVDQLVSRIPFEAPEGCYVPLSISANGARSPYVTVGLRSGHSQCFDFPSATLPLIRVDRTETRGVQPNASTIVEHLTASFLRAPFNLLVFAADPFVDYHDALRELPKRCRKAEPEQLNAGPITLRNANVVTPAVQFDGNGIAGYELDLPPGTIAPGLLTLSATGAMSVAPFSTSLVIPDAIRVTSELVPGSSIASNSVPFRLTWSGGQTGQLVNVTISYPDTLNPTQRRLYQYRQCRRCKRRGGNTSAAI